MDFYKIASAIPKALGKTVDGVFLVERSPSQWCLYLAFEDGTHYEFYGTGSISGARCVDRGGVDMLRQVFERSPSVKVTEVTRSVAAR